MVDGGQQEKGAPGRREAGGDGAWAGDRRLPRMCLVPRPAVLMLCLLLLLSGCRRKPAARLTFAVGGAPAELDVWEEIVRQFTEQTGIAVELLRQPTDSNQRRQGLLIPLKARQPDPDVFLMDVVWLAQFADSGWLLPLDEDAAPFWPRVVRLVDRRGGKLLALPINVDAGLLYYRKDLLKRYGFAGPPATWGELLREARTVQSGERRHHPGFWGYLWEGAEYEGLVCSFLEVAASAGGGIVEDGKIRLDRPANRRALAFLTALIRRARISPPNTYTQMREEEVRRAFQSGRALFERNWPYAWALHQAAGSAVAGKTGIAPLPHFPGQESAATLGGWHIGISRYTDRPAQARALVRYLTSDAVQKEMALHLGWNPGRRDLYHDPRVLAALPYLRPLRRVLAHAVARPVLPYYGQISRILQRHLNAALAGWVSPGKALRQAQAEIGTVTARYRTGRPR
jgi:multiple sugar transport system substrate-binding protein